MLTFYKPSSGHTQVFLESHGDPFTVSFSDSSYHGSAVLWLSSYILSFPSSCKRRTCSGKKPKARRDPSSLRHLLTLAPFNLKIMYSASAAVSGTCPSEAYPRGGCCTNGRAERYCAGGSLVVYEFWPAALTMRIMAMKVRRMSLRPMIVMPRCSIPHTEGYRDALLRSY